MIAVRPMTNPVPSCGRTPSAFASPITSPIGNDDVSPPGITGGGPTTVPVETRTSLTRSVKVLGGTAQISVNCVCPPLLYVMLYWAPAEAVVVGTRLTCKTPFTIGTVRLEVAMLEVSPARKLLH